MFIWPLPTTSAMVDELFVVAVHRGAGLGEALLEAAEAGCRAAGARALHLLVDPGNRRAQGLYARHGFQARRGQVMSKRLDD